MPINARVTVALLVVPVLIQYAISRTLDVNREFMWAGVTVHAIWNVLLLRAAASEAARHPGRWTLPRLLVLTALPAAFPLLLMLL